MVETLDHSGNGKTLVKARINSYLQLVVYREAEEYSSASFFMNVDRRIIRKCSQSFSHILINIFENQTVKCLSFH